MKILYLITRAELGGAQVHLLDLVKGLQDRHRIHVAVGEQGFLTEALGRIGIPCHHVRNLVHPIHPVQDVRAILEMSRLIRRVKPDLIHAHTSKAGLVARVAGRLMNVPVIFTAHTWAFAEGTSWKWRTLGIPSEKIAARLGSLTINVSEANRRLALSHNIGTPASMTTIHNGIPDVPWRARPLQDPPTIVMVARFALQKDHLLLLRCLAELPGDARIVFIGDGPRRSSVEAEARRLGLAKRVDFLGNRSDVSELLSHAQIFALATNWEGFPLSILEAMRAGLPVVATGVGGISEAVIDGETGLLAKAGDSNQFKAHLLSLISDAALRARLGQAARRRYELNFEVSVMLNQTDRTYQRIAQRGLNPTEKLAKTIGIH